MSETINPASAMTFKRSKLSKKKLLHFYDRLVLPRLIEEKMLSLLRQGKVSKWFAGIGQEAISVGCALALEEDEFMFTMHRNLGVFTTREVPFDRLFGQWQGKLTGYTKGRDRSFHFGATEHHIVGMISHLGPQLSLAAGVGLAHKLKKEKKVSLAFTGDGGTSQGEFHEALNLAAVWSLPTIFVIENNGYGLSTPVEEQYACDQLADRAKGYGMEGISIDGNNILEVYHTISKLAKDLRQNPRPVLVECRTFRMRGHEEASGVKYVPKELFDLWGKRDPVENFRAWLMAEGLLTAAEDEKLRAKHKAAILEGIAAADAAPLPTPDLGPELEDVYAPYAYDGGPEIAVDGPEKRLVDAIHEGLGQAMEAHPGLVLMGQDIGAYGGVFKITDGFVARFGESRVRNTPLCESAVVGAALGYHISSGEPAMMEMQFADFVTCGFNQIVNYLAKLHYRWGQSANVVIRMPTGGGMGAGPYHSQSNEAWFTHVPGLRVVYPSNPYDAKGLLLESFTDPNPVMFFEHKGLYRSVTGPLPEVPYRIPFGKARVVQEGSAATIITYGQGVHWAVSASAPVFDGTAHSVRSKTDRDIEIIDLRTLAPLDMDTVLASVRKTGRALILHEDTLFGGIGGEIAAQINEHAFASLDAPVMRVGSAETPIPFSKELEGVFMASNQLEEKLEELLAW